MTDITNIEKIQYQALKYVYNDFISSYAILRSKAKRPLLYVERLRVLILEVFKAINKIGPQYMYDMFKVKCNTHNLRLENTLVIPKYNTIKYGKQSISYQGCKVWNEAIDNNIRSIQSISLLKNAMKSWNGPNCNACNSCTICVLNNM